MGRTHLGAEWRYLLLFTVCSSNARHAPLPDLWSVQKYQGTRFRLQAASVAPFSFGCHHQQPWCVALFALCWTQGPSNRGACRRSTRCFCAVLAASCVMVMCLLATRVRASCAASLALPRRPLLTAFLCRSFVLAAVPTNCEGADEFVAPRTRLSVETRQSWSSN